MSHTEKQDVTYYNGHVIEVNGKRYVSEHTGLVAEDNLKLIDRCRELECELARVKAELGKLECERVTCDRDDLLKVAKEIEATGKYGLFNTPYEIEECELTRWSDRIRKAIGDVPDDATVA